MVHSLLGRKKKKWHLDGVEWFTMVIVPGTTVTFYDLWIEVFFLLSVKIVVDDEEPQSLQNKPKL